MDTGEASLTAAVRDLYERHPYPRYPLLARPRWQEGYLASSDFASRLAADVTGQRASKDGMAVLIAGGGEILPYVIRRLEPTFRQVVSIDLSRRSLNRVRMRLAMARGRTDLLRGDINDYLKSGEPGQAFAHIDAYGVLHHLPNPTATLALLARRLAPGGTARFMVYNSRARDWIWQLQKFYQMLGIDGLSGTDLAAARRLLAQVSEKLPALRSRLAQMGRAMLANDARFADTFLHPREARLSIAAWFAGVAEAGLKPLGLFDRYGELDDLPNPLWRCPTVEELIERANDYRFENNLELFVTKPGPPQPLTTVESGCRAGQHPSLDWSLPPHAWFSFQETRNLSFAHRWRLWREHRLWIRTGETRDLTTTLLKQLPAATAGRLARIGAVLPGQVRDRALYKTLLAPLAVSMEAPSLEAPVALVQAGLVDLLQAELARRGRLTPERLQACLERLYRAQQ